MSMRNSAFRAVRDAVVWVTMLVLVLSSSSCATKTPAQTDYRGFLGEYAYNASITAMVYEDFEGEGYGITYRAVTDFNGYITGAPLPVLLYFYSFLRSDAAGTIAEIEQIAEDYNDRVLIVTVDVTTESTIASHYRVETIPEFIVLRGGKVEARFDGTSRVEWSQEELRQWVIESIG